jgi:hypothetical protein
MVSGSHCKRDERGYTLLDLLVTICGVPSAIWLSGYFHGAWQPVMVCVLSLVFGIGFWCFLFLWLLPLIERIRKR